MFAQFLVELIGTFVLLAVILAATRPNSGVTCAPFAIGLALATAIFIGGAISGGHFNPAVSVMSVMNGSLDWKMAGVYIIGQLLAAAAAVGFYKYTYAA